VIANDGISRLGGNSSFGSRSDGYRIYTKKILVGWVDQSALYNNVCLLFNTFGNHGCGSNDAGFADFVKVAKGRKPAPLTRPDETSWAVFCLKF
jgi:hypothetical protein